MDDIQVPGVVYVNQALQELVFDELEQHCKAGGYGGFLPAVKQIGNVAALPGIVKYSIGMLSSLFTCLLVHLLICLLI